MCDGLPNRFVYQLHSQRARRQSQKDQFFIHSAHCDDIRNENLLNNWFKNENKTTPCVAPECGSGQRVEDTKKPKLDRISRDSLQNRWSDNE